MFSTENIFLVLEWKNVLENIKNNQPQCNANTTQDLDCSYIRTYKEGQAKWREWETNVSEEL